MKNLPLFTSMGDMWKGCTHLKSLPSTFLGHQTPQKQSGETNKCFTLSECSDKGGRKLLVALYRMTIESVLTYCIVWWSAADKKALQRLRKTRCPCRETSLCHNTLEGLERWLRTLLSLGTTFLIRYLLVCVTGLLKHVPLDSETHWHRQNITLNELLVYHYQNSHTFTVLCFKIEQFVIFICHILFLNDCVPVALYALIQWQ